MEPTDVDTVDDLIAALTALSSLPPVERALRCPMLIDAAKKVLSRHRGAAISAAQAQGLTLVEIARQLRVNRSKVTDALALYRRGTP